ncbi:MAG TPA: hydrogenase nickel incorporation protein HypB, partial [Candidatus Baltobacteraceae bacterium]|nr:hydrogenase nickel incorporation protein HypB [Candidatus Baltobacteraceae bacterium]
RRSGAPVKQIVTGAECRLDAQMVTAALREFDVSDAEVLAIENVGNLICPAEYDLGEDLRVVVFSTTEGEDKPLKYPLAFSTAQLVAISKMDLAEAAVFDREGAKANVERVHPGIEIVEVSALRGDGMDAWIECLDRHIANKRVLA